MAFFCSASVITHMHKSIADVIGSEDSLYCTCISNISYFHYFVIVAILLFYVCFSALEAFPVIPWKRRKSSHQQWIERCVFLDFLGELSR